MRRQTPGWNFRDQTVERAGTAMAHKRGLCERRVLRVGAVVLALAAGLAGALLVTVQVTHLRTSVAELEDHRECLLARNASLQATWARDTAPTIIRSRACRMGLEVATAPDFVLLRPNRDPQGTGPLRRLWANLGGEAAAEPGTSPGLLAGTMVFLQPRAAHAATGAPGGS